MTSTCPCCGGNYFRPVLRFENIPPSGRLLQSVQDRVDSIDLAFEVCNDCNLLRQNPLARKPDYGGVNRSTARQVPRYAQALLERLVTLGVAGGDLIVEVGSNDGSFLENLRSAEFSNVLGVEPSRELAQITRDRGFRVENAFFDHAFAERMILARGLPRAVICRHTLEHVSEPDAFVAALHDCCDPDRGILLLEVPDGSAIPELMNVYELWDEHLYFFAAENLNSLLVGQGFAVTEMVVAPHLETRNLIAWCRPTGARLERPLPSATLRTGCAAMWLSFPNRWTAYREGFAKALQAAPRPVYFIGAAHPQSNFASYIGVGACVDFMIDDDPEKVGRFVPLKGGVAAIISTRTFEASARTGTVVKSGFGYGQWMARICAHAAQTGMTVLDPRAFIT